MDDGLVHAADLGPWIAHHVQEQEVVEERHQLACVLYAVRRFIHDDADPALRAGLEQQLPDNPVHASRLVLDGTEDLFRVEDRRAISPCVVLHDGWSPFHAFPVSECAKSIGTFGIK